MGYRNQRMRLGFVLLFGVSIMLAGWLSSASVARAEQKGHGKADRLKVLSERIAEAKITLGEAVAEAEKATGGSAVFAAYELDDKGLEIEVKVLTAGKVKEVEFDAMTGKREIDDEGDDDDHHDDGDDDDNDNDNDHS